MSLMPAITVLDVSHYCLHWSPITVLDVCHYCLQWSAMTVPQGVSQTLASPGPLARDPSLCQEGAAQVNKDLEGSQDYS